MRWPIREEVQAPPAGEMTAVPFGNPAVDRTAPRHDTETERHWIRRLRASPLATRVTITDVAKVCGVTPATVSRVLNRRKDFNASEVLRKRIFETAEQMGYVPDLAARNLNRRSSNIIGVFASPFTHLGDGINESMLEGLADAFHTRGYDVFLEVAADGRRKKGLPFWRFDGAILLQSPKPETVSELDRRRVPYVCVNEQAGDPAACVLADDAVGMKSAVDHLAQLGHKTIAYANARPNYFVHYSVPERHDALVTSAKAHRMTLLPADAAAFDDPVAFLKRVVVQGRATAVIAYDHQIAVKVFGAAAGLSLRIPQDLSLLCFNDVFPVAVMPTPLTVVAVSGKEMGKVAAEQLLQVIDRQLIDRPGKPTPRELRVAEQLIVRASTSAPGR